MKNSHNIEHSLNGLLYLFSPPAINSWLVVISLVMFNNLYLSLFLEGLAAIKFFINLTSKFFLITSQESQGSPRASQILVKMNFPKLKESQVFLISVISFWIVLLKWLITLLIASSKGIKIPSNWLCSSFNWLFNPATALSKFTFLALPAFFNFCFSPKIFFWSSLNLSNSAFFGFASSISLLARSINVLTLSIIVKASLYLFCLSVKIFLYSEYLEEKNSQTSQKFFWLRVMFIPIFCLIAWYRLLV